MYPCYLPSLCTGLWVALLFISLPKGVLILLILLYVEDHLLLAESMMCIDNVLVEELTIRAPLDAAFPTGIPAQTAGEMRPVPFFHYLSRAAFWMMCGPKMSRAFSLYPR